MMTWTLGRYGKHAAALLLLLAYSIGCSGDTDHGTISASGVIEAVETDLSSKAAGEILALTVIEGSQVQVGDTIALIDHVALDLKLEQAAAAVVLADARLQLLLNGARSEDIERARQAVNQAESGLDVAQKDRDRMTELFDKGSVTGKQRDDAEARYDVALAQFRSAKQALKKVMTIARPEEIRAAEAQLRQAESVRDLTLKSISDCRITSPVRGIVTSLPVDMGELVGPGSIVATVSALDTVTLTIYISEIELGWVRFDQIATLSVDATPEKTFEGTVTFISPTAEFTPKSIQTKDERVKLVYGVKIRVPNPDMILKPGMPADAVIETGEQDNR
jgi:HlyD family secretion protein